MNVYEVTFSDSWEKSHVHVFLAVNFDEAVMAAKEWLKGEQRQSDIISVKFYATIDS